MAKLDYFLKSKNYTSIYENNANSFCIDIVSIHVIIYTIVFCNSRKKIKMGHKLEEKLKRKTGLDILGKPLQKSKNMF